MPVYIMFLVAITPILIMVVTSGDALGQDASLVALVALFGTLATLAAWLAGCGVRTVAEVWRRKMSGLTTSGSTARSHPCAASFKCVRCTASNFRALAVLDW